jgi:hypothetical protein
MTGGVSRLKYHLAKILGHVVGICSASTPEIMQVSHDVIYEKDKKKEEAIATKS